MPGNEKYKGDALLRKYYTPDFLTKKQVHNNGEVPQYYVEGIRGREFDRFIRAVEKLPGMVTEFDEALWGGLVDHMTVHAKDNIVFTLTGGMEIKA